MGWIIRGNVVTATRSPFSDEEPQGLFTNDPIQNNHTVASSSSVETETQAEAPNADDVVTAASSQDDRVVQLGPGLIMLLDYVVEVDNRGIIVSMEPFSPSSSSRWYPRCSSEQEKTAVRLELSPTQFLCPGLIDTHIHAPQFAFTGTATDRPLMGPQGWLEQYTFPVERAMQLVPPNNDPEQSPNDDDDHHHHDNKDNLLVQQVYRQVVRTTLQHGTTTALYYGTLHVAPCQVLVDEARSAGQRALIGKVCMDRHSPDNYCHSAQQNLQESEQLIQYILHQVSTMDTASMALPSPLIRPVLIPRFIPTCSPALLSGLGALAQQYQCHVTSHLSESVDEVAWTAYLDQTRDDGGPDPHHGCGGRTDTEIFEAYGLLIPRKTIMAHGVYLTESDLDLLQRRQVSVAHCPLSNFFFAGSSAPIRHYLDRHNHHHHHHHRRRRRSPKQAPDHPASTLPPLRVGLGTDVAGGYSPSLWHTARMAVVAAHAFQHQQDQHHGRLVGGPTHLKSTRASTPDKDQAGDDETPVDFNAVPVSAVDPTSTSHHHQQQQHILDYRHAFYLATLGGAEALGLDHCIGRLAVGMEFDALILTPDQHIPIFPGTTTLADVFQKLCVLGDDRHVTRVFVQGRDVTVR